MKPLVLILTVLMAYPSCGNGLNLSEKPDVPVVSEGEESTSGSNSSTTTPTAVTVSSLYSTNGANWMDYVKNDGSTRYTGTDTVCAATESAHFDCIHGGEKRKVTLSDRTSCTNLTITEDLGVFNWECVLISGIATFVTQGLKSDKGLTDLVNATSFKNNYVTIKESGTAVYESSAGTWWSNSFVAVSSPSDNQTYGTSGTIYTLSSDTAVNGIALNASKTAFVTLGTATLKWNGGTTNNLTTLTDGVATQKVLFAVNNGNFFWIEGKFDGYHATANADYVVYLHTPLFSHFRNIDAQNGDTAGMSIRYGNKNWAHRIRTGNNLGYGFILSLADTNIVDNVITYSNSWYGFSNNGGDNNTVTNVITASNGKSATSTIASGFVDGNGSQYNTYHGFTAVNNIEYGVEITVTLNAFSQLLTANNGIDGFNIASTGGGGTYAQVLAANNGTYGINEAASSAQTFHGTILAGNNGTDHCNAGGTAGLTDSTCALEGSSTVTATTGVAIDTASSFKGITATTASYVLGTDWLTSLSDYYKLWGISGSTYPNSDDRGTCLSGTCAVWDLSLDSGDSVILDRIASTCPTVSGNDTLSDLRSTPNTYLYNAFEIIGDSIGDEDGLCESSESCIYARNYGAYQGHGDYTNTTCSFTNGTVTGVTMYWYPSNGY